MMRFLFLVFVLSLTTGFSQHKTNEIGVYAAAGFNYPKKDNIFSKIRNNQVAFGLFYMRPFSPHFKWRIGLSGIYESGGNSLQSMYTRWSSVYIELPVQFQYIINPDGRFVAYTGIGLSFSRAFYTKWATSGEGYNTSTFKNDKVGLEFAPSVFIGLNARLSDHFSLFLQPGFSPLKIDYYNLRWPYFINAELGLIYKL